MCSRQPPIAKLSILFLFLSFQSTFGCLWLNNNASGHCSSFRPLSLYHFWLCGRCQQKTRCGFAASENQSFVVYFMAGHSLAVRVTVKMENRKTHFVCDWNNLQDSQIRMKKSTKSFLFPSTWASTLRREQFNFPIVGLRARKRFSHRRRHHRHRCHKQCISRIWIVVIKLMWCPKSTNLGLSSTCSALQKYHKCTR